MLKDVKTGLALWRKISGLKYTAAGFFAMIAAGFMAVTYVAPGFRERIKEVSRVAGMDGDEILLMVAVLFIIVFCAMLKTAVAEAYGRNRYLFYQLTVGKRAGCVCTMLLRPGRYGYGMVILLAVSGGVAAVWLLATAYTFLFVAAFGFYYSLADSEADGRGASAHRRTGRTEKKPLADFGKGRPGPELFKMTVCGLYRCRSLAAGKLIITIFLICCGCARILNGSVFLAAEALLILLNDGYWKNESGSFQYFSAIGIPLPGYLCVHFISGICFNMAIPLCVFYGMTRDIGVTAVCLALSSYLLVFWYLAQIYLYLVIGRDRETAILLLDLVFLALALLPVAGLLAMPWLYKKIAREWRKTGCSR